MIPLFSQWAQNTASTDRRKQKVNKKTLTTNTMAVVVEICRFKGKKNKKKLKHWQLPRRNISWDREQLGQYGSLVQWRPEEQPVARPQRSYGRAASTFIRPLALEGVAGRRVIGLKREVQWASSTLARKKNKGRHYASSHIYSLTHTHVHTYFILCKTTTAKA